MQCRRAAIHAHGESTARVAREFGFNAAELTTLVLNGVRATFLPEDEKQTLLHEIKHEIELLRDSVAGQYE